MSIYVRYPSVCETYAAFVLGQSIWKVRLDGKELLRLTDAYKGIGAPALSPLALAWSVKGQVFIQWNGQCHAEQLTYSTAAVSVLGWHGDRLIVKTGERNPFSIPELFFLCPRFKVLERLPCGEANAIAWGPEKQCVIQRAGYRYGAWQRYQGGTAGQLWVQNSTKEEFAPLLKDHNHNFVNPVSLGKRIFFLSDLSGWGNVHSMRWDGSDMQQHTHHKTFYAMHLTGSENHLVYTVGGELHQLTLDDMSVTTVSVSLSTDTLEDTYTFCDPEQYYRESCLSEKGKYLALITRGRLFQLTAHKGPVWQLPYGDGSYAHYRCVQWLSENEIAVICDEGKQDIIQIFESQDSIPGPALDSEPKTYTWSDFSGIDREWGRIVAMQVHAKKRYLVLSNHRHELFWLNLEAKTGTWIETHNVDSFQQREKILGMNWSPCGRWVAYGFPKRMHASSIMLYDTQQHTHHEIVKDMFENVAPVFDPKGRYLFFFSARHVESSFDPLHFSSQFDAPILPFVVTLSRDTPSLCYAALEDSDTKTKDPEKEEDKKETHAEHTVEQEQKKTDVEHIPELQIDFEAINQRIQPLSVEPRAYTQLACLEDSILYSALADGQKLWRYSFADLTEELILDQVQDWSISSDQKWMAYISHGKLRVVRAGVKPDETPDTSFRMGGWIDWKRVPLRVCPRKEWRQMFDEAWRLQRDLFWRSDLGGIDWESVYARYRPLVDCITHVEELWTIIEEMHGELGTSHAYVMATKHTQNFGEAATLGASFAYDNEAQAYRIERFLIPSSWQSGPLQRPGLNIQEGDFIWSIGGHRLSKTLPPSRWLWGRAGYGEPIEVGPSFETRRTVVVFPERGEKEAEWRYESWVLEKTQYVHEQSKGKLGYIHIPDMGCEGMNIFMRAYLQEFDRKGLVIDARCNGGGNVSEIIFRYLTQKRIGYDQSRWSGITPYPRLSPRGPMVLLVNAYTGSDGDMFAYAFKAWNLGTVIGKRTWGGVVGICPKYSLLDGSYTTQPEYAIWFPEAGWSVENTGVQPDIEIELSPKHQVLGEDPQLDRAIQEALVAVERDDERQKTLIPSRT